MLFDAFFVTKDEVPDGFLIRVALYKPSASQVFSSNLAPPVPVHAADNINGQFSNKITASSRPRRRFNLHHTHDGDISSFSIGLLMRIALPSESPRSLAPVEKDQSMDADLLEELRKIPPLHAGGRINGAALREPPSSSL